MVEKEANMKKWGGKQSGAGRPKQDGLVTTFPGRKSGDKDPRWKATKPVRVDPIFKRFWAMYEANHKPRAFWLHFLENQNVYPMKVEESTTLYNEIGQGKGFDVLDFSAVFDSYYERLMAEANQLPRPFHSPFFFAGVRPLCWWIAATDDFLPDR